jgi:CubicO group peptidase (beta-lactamase class C family)
MRLSILAILCIFFYAPIPLHATTEPLDFDHVKATELLLELGIINGTIAGGVVVVGNHAGILARSARGKVSTAPEALPIDDQTVFDLASLTKVIATTPAVMKLVDAGKVSLQDPLVKWFPEFKWSKYERITITHLLTHTSGLVDFELNADQTMKSTIARAAAETGQLAIGTFNYADLNFILLGELVKRVSGKSLDAFCSDELYAPLQAPTLTFLPPASILPRVAPTAGNAPGIVQDQNSRRLGGVAGHAGLFSSAEDLSKFARMMLGNGELEGRRILSEQAVRQMVAPITCGATAVRGLGWDIQSSYSAPKGKLCSAGSYGP